MPTVKWVTVFARKRKFENFSAEIEAHLKLATSVSQEEGHSYEEARAAAHRAFGNLYLDTVPIRQGQVAVGPMRRWSRLLVTVPLLVRDARHQLQMRVN